MTWEQKLAAMKSLVGDFNVFLMMRAPEIGTFLLVDARLRMA